MIITVINIDKTLECIQFEDSEGKNLDTMKKLI